MCSLRSKHYFIFPHILWRWILILVIVFQQLQKIAVGSTFWFSAPSFVFCFGSRLLWIILDNHKLVEYIIGWLVLAQKRISSATISIFLHCQKESKMSGKQFSFIRSSPKYSQAVPTSHFCHNWVPRFAILVLTAAGTRTPSLEDTSIINEHTWPFRKSQTVWILDNNAHHRKQLTFVRFL